MATTSLYFVTTIGIIILLFAYILVRDEATTILNYLRNHKKRFRGNEENTLECSLHIFNMTDFVLPNKAKEFIAGGIAGCTAKTFVAPLDRVKILLQAHNHHYKKLGIFSTIWHIQKKEGFLGLYKSNGVQMFRMFPYSAIQYSTFNTYKKFVTDIIGNQNITAVKFLSGSLSGFTAVTCTYPLDVVRARLAFQVTGEHVYNGGLHILKNMLFVDGGVKALYRGYSATLCYILPYSGLSFMTFGILKEQLLKRYPELFGIPSPSGNMVLQGPYKLLCGGVAGLVAQSMAYPLDVVRRRLQLSVMLPDSHKYDRGLIQTLKVIYKEDGVVRGLYRGLSVNYIRVIPMMAMSFFVFETCMQKFGLDTSVASL